MSSVLKRNKKPMTVNGFTEEELSGIARSHNHRKKTDKLISDTYYNLRDIYYQILHDKFGFGNKRIVRLEQTVDQYITLSESDWSFEPKNLNRYLMEKWGIDVKSEIKSVPGREVQALIYSDYQITMDRLDSVKTISATMYASLVVTVTVLKTKFNFSKNMIDKFIWWVKYYLNSLSIKGLDLDILGIASALYCECNYLDSRFDGKVYEV